MSDDAFAFVEAAVLMALCIAACIKTGGVLTKSGWVPRRENEGLFWLGITLPSAGLFMMLLFGGFWFVTH